MQIIEQVNFRLDDKLQARVTYVPHPTPKKPYGCKIPTKRYLECQSHFKQKTRSVRSIVKHSERRHILVSETHMTAQSYMTEGIQNIPHYPPDKQMKGMR